MSTITSLRKLYKNPEVGLVGKNAFINNLKSRNIKFDLDLIDELYHESAIALNNNVVMKFKRRRVYVYHVDQTWGGDLISLPSVADMNDNIKYFLIVIDFFSKYAWVEPLQDAKAITVSHAFEKIFKESGRKPQNINTDLGSEFKAATLKLFKSLDINHYVSYNETKVPIAERFARTLKQRLGRLMDAHDTYRFVDFLPKVVKGYNKTYHSSIKMTPIEASNPENEETVYHNLYGGDNLRTVKKPKYAIGDHVRISIKKGIFEKETTHKWTPEKFIITDVIMTNPVVYKIRELTGKKEELKGAFYEPELLKTIVDDDIQDVKVLKKRTVRGQKQAYIQYSDKSRAWIREIDLMS